MEAAIGDVVRLDASAPDLNISDSSVPIDAAAPIDTAFPVDAAENTDASVPCTATASAARETNLFTVIVQDKPP